jgi:dTMP kinase
MFLADRVQHIEKVILPTLEKGKIVICDRFVDSTIAYQVGGRKLERRIMNYLNGLVTKSLNPHLTFLLMVNPKIGLERARTSRKHRITVKDRFEEEPLDFHQRVYQMYKEIADKNKDRVRIIDTSRDLRSVQLEVRKHIDGFLKGRV